MRSSRPRRLPRKSRRFYSVSCDPVAIYRDLRVENIPTGGLHGAIGGMGIQQLDVLVRRILGGLEVAHPNNSVIRI